LLVSEKTSASSDLELRGVYFVEYDVEKDPQALRLMLGLTGGNKTVFVIFEEGKPVQVGSYRSNTVRTPSSMDIMMRCRSPCSPCR
jgi:hypothetical protein